MCIDRIAIADKNSNTSTRWEPYVGHGLHIICVHVIHSCTSSIRSGSNRANIWNTNSQATCIMLLRQIVQCFYRYIRFCYILLLYHWILLHTYTIQISFVLFHRSSVLVRFHIVFVFMYRNHWNRWCAPKYAYWKANCIINQMKYKRIFAWRNSICMQRKCIWLPSELRWVLNSFFLTNFTRCAYYICIDSE